MEFNNVIMVTFYEPILMEHMRTSILKIYDYVIITKEATKRSGLYHYHALAYSLKASKQKSDLINLRRRILKEFKKYSPIKINKYNLNIIHVTYYTNGYDYVTKEGNFIFSNIPPSLHHELVRKGPNGLGPIRAVSSPQGDISKAESPR